MVLKKPFVIWVVLDPDSHHRIHQGLDQYDLLLSKYRADPKEYNPVEFRACLSSFKDVLFMHLDEEVEDLGAANMKKYVSFKAGF